MVKEQLVVEMTPGNLVHKINLLGEECPMSAKEKNSLLKLLNIAMKGENAYVGVSNGKLSFVTVNWKMKDRYAGVPHMKL